MKNPRLPLENGRLLFQAVPEASRDVLITVFLRGGMDGLYLIPPFADPFYHKLRGRLHPGDPGVHGGITSLDDYFGLHPSLKPLHRFFLEGTLAIVHACGSADKSLSHFHATKIFERGVEDPSMTSSGWLARFLNQENSMRASPLRAVTISKTLSGLLQGATNSYALNSLEDFRLDVPLDWESSYQSSLSHFYSEGEDSASIAGRGILQLMTKLEKVRASKYVPAGDVRYPRSSFAQGLSQIAQLIKSDVGLEAATIELAGWDNHLDQPAKIAEPIRTLGRALSAFVRDLDRQMGNTTILIMTEFGRRVVPNEVLGTDHGRGTAMMVIGGNIAGGKIYGNWPGIGEHQLDSVGNLKVTTDIRNVLSEVLTKRMKCGAINHVFPDFTPTYLNIAK